MSVERTRNGCIPSSFRYLLTDVSDTKLTLREISKEMGKLRYAPVDVGFEIRRGSCGRESGRSEIGTVFIEHIRRLLAVDSLLSIAAVH
jgi:hypothetical protein